MPTHEAGQVIDFGGPVTYRIVVQGAVSEHWRDRLAGLTMATRRRPGDVARTTLVGPVRDQAELSGVLDTLYGLHLPLLKVETVRARKGRALPRP